SSALTDPALACSCPAGKQRRAVEDDTDARTAFPGVTHLADQVQQKQQGAIRHTRQARAETTVVALLGVLIGDLLLHILPLHTEGWVAEHEVEVMFGAG